MDKVKIAEQFEQMLREKFPNRKKPISKQIRPLGTNRFDDSRFSEWRKNR